MKYIKTYENATIADKTGYYIQLQYKAIVNDDSKLFYEWIDWIDSHIGKIINVSQDSIVIQYENVPDRILYRFDLNPNTNKYCYRCDIHLLPNYFIGKTPEEVIIKAQSNKFNI